MVVGASTARRLALVLRALSGPPLRGLAFRDHLRADPPTAVECETLKVALATRYPNDREAYTEAKEDFIESVLRGQRSWGHFMKLRYPS